MKNINQMNRLKNNRRGLHVGIMISFVIFTGFILFFYLIIQPNVIRQEKQGFLDSTKARLIDEVSEELRIASVKINGAEGGGGCFQLNHFLAETGMSEKLIALNNDGESLTADVNGDHLEVEGRGVSFFRIYESEEFGEIEGDLNGCGGLTEGEGYRLGSLKSEEEIFESMIIKIADKYENNLSGLKEDLNMAGVNEFGFSFEYSDGTVISVGQEEIVNLDVYVSDSQIQYINNNASREVGHLNVRVW